MRGREGGVKTHFDDVVEVGKDGFHLVDLLDLCRVVDHEAEDFVTEIDVAFGDEVVE